MITSTCLQKPAAWLAAAMTPETVRQLQRVADLLRASPFIRLAVQGVATEPDHAALRAHAVSAEIVALHPSLNLYPGSSEPIGTPSIRTGTPFNGMTDLYVSEKNRRKGYGKALILDVVRRLKDDLVTHVEVVIPESDPSTLQLFTKMGFEPFDVGTVYRRA